MPHGEAPFNRALASVRHAELALGSVGRAARVGADSVAAVLAADASRSSVRVAAVLRALSVPSVPCAQPARLHV